MILPTDAIHLLERLKFRFHEDHGIDERLIEAFMQTTSTFEAATSVLHHLESSLVARDLFLWKNTGEDKYELIATSKDRIDQTTVLPEPFKHVADLHWIRFEPISSDWQNFIRLLYGTEKGDISAIDVKNEASHLLLIVWGESPSKHAPIDPALALLSVAVGLDDFPPSLQRSIRALNGKKYSLPALLALHRLHDGDTAIRHDHAVALAKSWISKDDPAIERIETMIRIQDVGTLLAPKYILEKHKRSVGETELIEETLDSTADLLEVFSLPTEALQVLTWDDASITKPLPFAVSIALSAWHCANVFKVSHRKKVPKTLAKRLDPRARLILKAKRLA
jgi:hypothetical protein